MHELDHSLPINIAEQPNLFSGDVTPFFFFFFFLPKACIKSLILRAGDQHYGLICNDERLKFFSTCILHSLSINCLKILEIASLIPQISPSTLLSILSSRLQEVPFILLM